MRRALRCGVIFYGVLVALLATVPAWAHDAGVFYPGSWPTPQRANLTIYNEPSLSGAALSRVLSGAKVWENVGTSLNFSRIATKSLSHEPCDAGLENKNVVYMGSIDGAGNNLAATYVCHRINEMTRFVTVFDSADNWYTGTSTTVPAGRPDLASVATHEFGHASGWAHHYDDAGVDPGGLICGNNSGQATMCATHYKGTARQRSLQTHDVHTFKAAYP